MTVNELLQMLDNVREGGSGWTARCPSHDDKQNSLSIGTGDDGRILLKCFAGCSIEEIVDALHLDVRDLFPNSGRQRGKRERGESQ